MHISFLKESVDNFEIDNKLKRANFWLGVQYPPKPLGVVAIII